MSKAKHCIILVHGTFSSPEMWEADYVNELKENIGKDVDVIRWKWSGKNSFIERHEASLQLKDFILKQAGYQSVFLVGHSHGGTVASMAGSYIGGHANVKGIVTLSTPFPITLKRETAEGAKSWSTMIATLCIITILAIGLSIIIYLNQFLPDYIIGWLVLGFLVVMASASSYFFGAFRLKISESLKSYMTKKMDEQFKLTPSIKTKTPIYSIATGGDEALGYLNIVTAICDLPYWLLHRYLVIAIMASTYFTANLKYIIREVSNYYQVTFWEILHSTLHALIGLCIVGPIVVLLSLYALTLVAVVLMGISSLISGSRFGFGSASILGNLVVRRLAAPVAPNYQESRFEQIDSKLNLRHSSLHKDPYACSLVYNWIRKQLRRKEKEHVFSNQNEAEEGSILQSSGCLLILAMFVLLAPISCIEEIASKEFYYDELQNHVFTIETHRVEITFPDKWRFRGRPLQEKDDYYLFVGPNYQGKKKRPVISYVTYEGIGEELKTLQECTNTVTGWLAGRKMVIVLKSNISDLESREIYYHEYFPEKDIDTWACDIVFLKDGVMHHLKIHAGSMNKANLEILVEHFRENVRVLDEN